MPKKLKFEKSNQEAVCKLHNNTYRVMSIFNNDGKKNILKYYQVQKNRKKISNCKELETAIRKMMAEANYELQDLFRTENLQKETKNKEISKKTAFKIQIGGKFYIAEKEITKKIYEKQIDINLHNKGEKKEVMYNKGKYYFMKEVTYEIYKNV